MGNGLSIALAVTAIAAFLVFVFDFGVRKSSKRIQDVQDEIIRAKDLEAGVAAAAVQRDISKSNQHAAEANERATKAQESLALAEQHSAEANAKAEGFRLDIATANEGAAEANRIAEQERLARIKIEERLSPRRLDLGQMQQVALKLKPFPATPFELGVNPIPEALSFVGIIDSVLRSAGWVNHESERKDFRSQFTLTSGSKVEQEYSSLVVVKLTKALFDKHKLAVEVLIQALQAEGIATRGELLKDDDPSPNNIHITVGSKE